MDKKWTLSEGLIAFLQKRLADPDISSITKPGERYYPTIIWEYGSTQERPGHPPESLPARYGLGLMPSSYSGKMMRISNEVFGAVLFRPRAEDQNAANRLIDYDGTDIVVR